jgi:hypothetical protein
MSTQTRARGPTFAIRENRLSLRSPCLSVYNPANLLHTRTQDITMHGCGRRCDSKRKPRGRKDMKDYLPFVPNVFFKVLAVTMTLVLVGYVIAFIIYGEITNVDIVGSLITAPIFAYLIHLWITMGKDW